MGTGEKKSRREVNRFLSKFSLQDAKTAYPLGAHPKARDIIVEFAEPLEGLFDTFATRYSMAIFAWNLSMASEERRSKAIDEFTASFIGDSEEGRRAVGGLLEAMVERRLDLYSDKVFLIVPPGGDEREKKGGD